MNSISNEEWDRFFAALERTAVLRTACKHAGIGRRTVYDRLAVARAENATPEAKEWLSRFDAANDEAGDVVEEEIFRRGVEGVEEPVFGRVAKHKDGQIGTIRKYSDALLVRLAQARRPEKFRDKAQITQEVSGPGGKPIQSESRVIVLPVIDENQPE